MAPLLQARGLGKRFGGIQALEGVDFALEAGEVHALLGENGAGKSTLARILAGVHQADEGAVLFRGEPVRFGTPREALRHGISLVSQEVNLIPDLSVAANIFMGRFPVGSFLRTVDRRRMERESERLLADLGLALDPGALVRHLPFSSRQVVEIARALSWRARVLILDEPTSALSEAEIDRLCASLARLMGEGVGIVYITHRLDEVFRLADRVTVLRDGRIVRSVGTAEAGVTKDLLIQWMIGRPVDHLAVTRRPPAGRERLRIEGLTARGRFRDVSLSVSAGEIVGLTGLAGCGCTEVGLALFGAIPVDAGWLAVDGERARLAGPREAVRRGLGLVPEDRKKQGLVPRMSVGENIAMVRPERVASAGFLSRRRLRGLAQGFIERLGIRTRGPEQPVLGLSGGNQQKVVLSKWLAAEAGILILTEPTRGIDVGAKAEIHRLIAGLADQGYAILLISSELPEILRVCEVVWVMHEGRITGRFPRAAASEAGIMAAAHGEVHAA